MITLNIREKGHLIEIPGMAAFRTPAIIDISKGDIKTIVGYLKVCDISDYEIIAKNDLGVTETYNAKDFSTANRKKKKTKKPNKDLTNRMNRIEKMIEKLYKKSSGDSSKNTEQNINQTEMFQKQILDSLKHLGTGGGKNEGKGQIKDDLEKEVEPYIPDIDIKGMKLNTQKNTKTIKTDKSDTDDSVDALSKLLNK